MLGIGGKETIDIDVDIDVYQCDESFNEIATPPPLTQDDIFRVCVETANDSVFEVGKVKDLTVVQDGTNYFYVTSFQDSYWAISSCENTNTSTAKCQVQLQLLGEFFIDSNPTDLTIEGIVKLDYVDNAVQSESVEGGNGGSGRRKRILVGGEEEKNAVFTMNVALDATSSGGARKPYNSFYWNVFLTLIVVVGMNVVSNRMKY